LAAHTPGGKRSIAPAPVTPRALPKNDWLCLGVTGRKRTHHYQAGVEEVWENPYDMSKLTLARLGRSSGNGTFAVGAKAGNITGNQRHGLLNHGPALYNATDDG
jgi:hypothetical protein